jgi:hypothetical protein
MASQEFAQSFMTSSDGEDEHTAKTMLRKRRALYRWRAACRRHAGAGSRRIAFLIYRRASNFKSHKV